MSGLKAIPNLLTGARIVLAVGVFLLLAEAGREPAALRGLALWACAAFVVAALTDYFDGWLARRWNAQSPWGTALDPIADKIAVLAVVLGLLLVRPRLGLAIPGFLILFREMFVSGLREAGAGYSIKLPVTWLAKCKTTVQLIALSVELLALGLASSPLTLAGDVLLWIAAAATLWTGAQYAVAFSRATAGRTPQ
ncbi:CDP-diacylglycerol--glycerol-3-phosphate 3-phosphatidyltransferase [Caulobacter sp. S45]|uniref:CDP-diacylglycerol--glycerol-3-phosphate 3-phosphatidyltransferase n=1 Tax=Caulobacter sp. S45 TaxID=1641861 RepID=UPI00131E1D5C|nr:CDP-diacylglycerol--glycerol-3-phosphate 3-phosphatidyltransferase [Caulobacter sp. S45]